MMLLVIDRVCPGPESILGVLAEVEEDSDGRYTAWQPLCFTLEDPRRSQKVDGRTAIPAGAYDLRLRKTPSPMNGRYAQKFGAKHRGMLWLQSVPDFEYVYLHIGNTVDDTAGCILLGLQALLNPAGDAGELYHSTDAYWSIYDRIADQIEAGERVTLIINDR